MKSGTVLFLGSFVALGVSWGGLVIGSQRQLSKLAPYYDQLESKALPELPSGIGERGKLVYRDLGCAACHTQMVRRPGFGGDVERKWGERQSYARDYIHQTRVELGQLRVGPDLTNVGARIKSASDVYKLLYAGTANMPAYPFLFEEAPLQAQPSPNAVATVDGRQVVPTARAQELAAYMLSLKMVGDYPLEKASNTIAAKKAAEKHEAEKEAEKK